MNSSKQIKLGAVLSYVTIAFNMIAGLIYTPWMLDKIGQSNYGLYTLTTSFITLFVMDFGMSAAVSRFVSKYHAMDDQDAMNNFLGLVYKLYFLIDMIILVLLVALYFFVGRIYGNLTAAELQTFRSLYIIVGLFSVISFPFTNLNGILTAHEKFVQLKLCDLFHKASIVAAMVICLSRGMGVFALVTVNAISGVLTILMKLWIVKTTTRVRVNFRFSDRHLLKEIFGFSMWTTFSSIAQRLIFNITPSIITMVSITGTVGVAVFGLASTIEGYIYTFAAAVSGMFIVRISKIVVSGNRERELLPLMIKVGRIQLMIVGLLTVGFVTMGQSFIVDIWDKPDFILSYYCAVLIIVPSVFHMPMEIANTALVVEGKIKWQSFAYIIMGLINVFFSLILSYLFGAIGASTSIFIAYMIRTAAMTIVHKKILNIDMKEFFKQTFGKLSPWLCATAIVGFLLEKFNPMRHGYLRFGVNGVLLVSVFMALMCLFGFNAYEKELFGSALRKIPRKLMKK